MSSKERIPDGLGIQQGIKPVLLSVAAGTVACIAALLLFSLIMSSRNIPQGLVSPMATFAISVGGLVGGYVCAKLMRERGLLWGLICGVVLCFVLLLSSLGISDSGFGVSALFKVVFILLCSMLGGVLGVNTRRKRRSSKR